MKVLQLSSVEPVPCADSRARIIPRVRAFVAQIPRPRSHARVIACSAPASPFLRSKFILLQQNTPPTTVPGTTRAPLIYAVDDMPELTSLYTTLLEAIGCSVRAFNDRTHALAALRSESTRPDLLITDCVGGSIPVDRFINHCLAVHPGLRILMASGLNPDHASITGAQPDRFIQKPFTFDEFHHEVRAALAA